MPPNKDKFFYINYIAFEKDSWLLTRFLEEAKRGTMQDNLPTLARLCIKGYFELIDGITLANRDGLSPHQVSTPLNPITLLTDDEASDLDTVDDLYK